MKRAWQAIVAWWRAFVDLWRTSLPIDQFGKPEDWEAKPQSLEFHKPIAVDKDPEAEALAGMNKRTADRSLQPGKAHQVPGIEIPRSETCASEDAATIALLQTQLLEARNDVEVLQKRLDRQAATLDDAFKTINRQTQSLDTAYAATAAMERPLHSLQLRGFVPANLRGPDLANAVAAVFLEMRDDHHAALEKLRLQQKRTRASRAAKRKPKQTVSKAHGRRRTS